MKLIDFTAQVIIGFDQSGGTLFGHFMGISNKPQMTNRFIAGSMCINQKFIG